MNTYEVLEIAEIQKQIYQQAITTMGQAEVEHLTFFDSKLALQRQLARQQAALNLTVQFGAPSFSGLQDIESALEHSLKEGTLSIEQLVNISRFSHGMGQLIDYGKKHRTQLADLDDLFESLFTNLSLAQNIDRCFSMDFEVYDQASTQLLAIRQQLRKVEERISNSTQYFLNKYGNMLTDQYATLRNQRLVLPVKTSEKNNFKGIVHDQSATRQTTFIEPQEMVDLNNEKQNLLVEEKVEIQRICHQLSLQVKTVAEPYIAAQQTSGMLDGLFAKAKWAKNLDGCVPSLIDEGFYLKEARHPLLDQKLVVANTFTLKPPHHMILITGPNTGGKTVGLKTIGISLYLAQCGYPILCEEAQFSMHDAFYVDIGDHQSILESLSTFSSHVRNLKIVLEGATSRSLVLLDELGSGTDPLEGESLAQAILEELYARKTPTIATSHYNKLKEFANHHQNIISASVQFDLSTLSPTFKYVDTMSGQSYGLDIAQKLELDAKVIQRSKQIKEEAQSATLQLIEQLEKQVAQQEVLNEKLAAQEKELQATQKQYKKQLDKLEAEKASMLKTFENKQDARIQKILRQAQQHLASIRDLEKEHEVLASIEEMKQFQHEPEVVESPSKNLKVNDHVRVLGTQQVGVIMELDKKEAILDVRGIRMNVPLNKLRIHQAKVSKTSKKRTKVSSSFSAVSTSSLEVNLIGMRYEEAKIELTKFIDQSVVARRTMFRVIHGHGTGALREMTHKILRTHPAVESFRLGQENEGGVGATVVTLKS